MGRKESIRQAALAERMHSVEEALRLALQARGYTCEGGTVALDGEPLEFWCYEPSRRTRVALTAAEMRYASGQTSKQVLMPSGRLVLVARLARQKNRERRWTDKRQPLEAQINQIVAQFEAMAQSAKEDRASIEAHTLQYENAMRRAAWRIHHERLREQRGERLHDLAGDWEDVVRLRAFLDAMRARLGSEPSPVMARWLGWAHAYVETLDPLSPAQLKALETFETSLGETPDDDGDPHPDEQVWRENGFLNKYLEELD